MVYSSNKTNNLRKNMKKEVMPFEIKKKPYSSPNVKKYGTYSEYTKGQGTNGDHADGQTYYGQALRS
jgi:hypothetical protein